MRHRHGPRKLNSTSAHRKATMQALCNALIEHEAINTTLPKAKELRRTLEPLVTLARDPSLANKRLAFSRLRDRGSVAKLFDDIAPRFEGRPGGYLRVLKNGFRNGDAAPMAFVEFVVRDRKLEVEEDEVIDDDGEEVADEAPGEQAEPEAQAEPAEEAVEEPAEAPAEEPSGDQPEGEQPEEAEEKKGE